MQRMQRMQCMQCMQLCLHVLAMCLLVWPPRACSALKHARPLLRRSPQIVSGGALGVGTVDRSTVGKFVMPAVEPFQRPLTFQLDAAALAAAVGDGSSMAAPAPTGMGGGMGRGSNAAFVTLIVMLSVLGAALLGALVWLAVRLARAPKAAAAVAGSAGVAGNGASPFDDGVGRPAGSIAMSPLEQQARAHGPSGGI